LRPYFEKLFPEARLKEQISAKSIDMGPVIENVYDQLPDHLRRSMSRDELVVLTKQIVESGIGIGPPLRLSREALVKWCALRESNSRPSGSM
jgi:hypothetical protein